MKRALVLGGGGPVGVAWETGLVHGLAEAGFELDSIEAFVGTSAGAIVGAQLAHGGLPSGPVVERAPGQSDPGVGGAPRRPVVDPGAYDVDAMKRVFALWGKIQYTTEQDTTAIGAIARGLYRDAEPAWIAEIERTLPVFEWPERPLFVCAIDTETGARRVFQRGDGVPLQRAIAASSSVPTLFPAVEIEGRLYMDGQVYSSTNADVLLAQRPDQVLIAVPTTPATGRAIGPHAERMLAREVDALRAAGSEVIVTTTTSADIQRMGGNLMDFTRIRDAFAVGLDAGRAWAEKLL